MRIVVKCLGSNSNAERDFDSARRAARVAWVPTEGWERDDAGTRFLILAIADMTAYVEDDLVG